MAKAPKAQEKPQARGGEDYGRDAEAAGEFMDVGASEAPGKKPDLGSIMRQLSGVTQIIGNVKEWVGVFNPRAIGVETYELMRTDPDVAFGLALLRAPIINMKWSVESADPVIKAFVEAEMKQWYRQFATAASMAIGNGWQALEKVWESKPVNLTMEDKAAGTTDTLAMPMAWTYGKFKGLDPRTVTLLVDAEKDEWAGISQQGWGLLSRAGKGEQRVGTDKSVLWSFRKDEVWGRLTGSGMLKQAYEPWWWKAAMNLFANRYFERRADPAWKAFADALVDSGNGQKQDGFQFVINALMGLRNGGVAAFPNLRDHLGNRKFDAELVMDDKRGDMFQQRIEWLSVQILRALWITDKAGTSDGTGSLAMAEVHADSMSRMMESILREFLDDVLNPQVIKPLVVFNFGEAAWEATNTRVTSGGVSASMQELLKTVLTGLLGMEQALKSGKSVTLAEMIDGRQVAQAMDLPIKSDDELELYAEEKEKRKAEEMKALNGMEPGQAPEPDDEGTEEELVGRGHLEE